MTTSPAPHAAAGVALSAADLVEATDWAATSLGPPEAWSPALRTATSICLESRFPILVWWGPDLVMRYNDAYAPILGDKHPAAMGMRGRDCWPEIWDVIGPMLEGVLRDGSATWSEDQLLLLKRRGFAEECYFTFSYSPIRDGDAVGGVFTAVTETTERVIRERRLAVIRSLASRARTVAEAVGGPIAILEGADHDIPFAVLEVEDDERHLAAAGTGTGALRHVADGGLRRRFDPPPEGLLVDAGELLARPVTRPWGTPVERALVLPLGGGSGRRLGTLVLGISPALSLDKEYLDFLRVVGDRVDAAIADARSLEAERRRADSLAALDAAKTTFFANVSHELRTPLALLLGPLAELDGSEALDAEDRERVALAVRNGRRLHRLVDNLLDVMRLDAGRLEPRPEPVDLGALTASVASMFEDAYRRAGLALDVVVGRLAGTAWVDPELWERIVANLLANALKFTPQGGVSVTVDAAGARARVVVRDTGIGIPAADLDRVFDRFVRLDQPGARSREGSGIGLALTAELVRLHGGTIDVDSEVGRGTAFTVTLPLVVAGDRPVPVVGRRAGTAGAGAVLEDVEQWLDEAAPAAPSGERGAGDGSGPDETTVAGGEGPAEGTFRGARILVADDNRDMRGYIFHLLRGARVTAVADGTAALAELRRGRVDLLVADVMMPGLDGLELVRQVRADPAIAAVPVILLSARAGEEASLEGLAAGADDYLVKPFTPTELVGRVAARLAAARERQRAEAALREADGRWRVLTEESPAYIALLDPAGQVLSISRAWREHLGGDGPAQGWIEAIHPDDLPSLRAHWEEANRTGNRVTTERIRVRREDDGEHRWFDSILSPVVDGDGAVRMWVAVSHDVHERTEAQHELEAALGAKDEFLGLVSHELRTPLTTVLGGARILADRDGRMDADERRELVADLSAEAERLNRVVENLLTLSRASAGAPPDLEPVLVGRLVRQLVGGRLRDLPGRELRVALRDGEALALAHAGYLEQILANLVSNADKYSDPGEPIDIEVGREDDEVVVSVADRGEGFTAGEAERLFDPFYRSPRTATKAGIGIGLTVCRRLVEAQGGRLWAAPREGGGSVFSVALPAVILEE